MNKDLNNLPEETLKESRFYQGVIEEKDHIEII